MDGTSKADRLKTWRRRLSSAAGCSCLVGGWKTRHVDTFDRSVEIRSQKSEALAISRPAVRKPLGCFAHSLDVGMGKPLRKPRKLRETGIWC